MFCGGWRGDSGARCPPLRIVRRFGRRTRQDGQKSFTPSHLETDGLPCWECWISRMLLGMLNRSGMRITYWVCTQPIGYAGILFTYHFRTRSSLDIRLLSVKVESNASRLDSLKSFLCSDYLLHRREGVMHGRK